MRQRPRATPREATADERREFERAVAALGGRETRAQAQDKEGPRAPSQAPGRRRRASQPPREQLDLHGLDRERARQRLVAFLATARGPRLLVIHGKGSGQLAALVAALLAAHPRVAAHALAPPSWGGDGARVVELRRAARSRRASQRP